MADTILIKCGKLNGRAKMPSLDYKQSSEGNRQIGGELGFNTEEQALYIGTDKGNVRLCGANDIGNLIAQINANNAILAEINGTLESIRKEIDDINTEIESINTRLGALETPSE